MTTYAIYLTAQDGEGVPQSLADWNPDDGPLVLHLNAFAADGVITIERKLEI